MCCFVCDSFYSYVNCLHLFSESFFLQPFSFFYLGKRGRPERGGGGDREVISYYFVLSLYYMSVFDSLQSIGQCL